MKRRLFQLILYFLATFFVVIGIYRLTLPYVLLWRVKQDLNAIYRTYRPFSYRWSGAPYGGIPPESRSIPGYVLAKQQARIRRAELLLGQTTNIGMLKGRLKLLDGRYDAALTEYRRALLTDPDNQVLELELGISFSLRGQREQRALDFEFGMEHLLQAERKGDTPEAAFDIALLCAEIPVFFQAVQRWGSIADNDPSSEWRREARDRLTKIREFRDKRERLQQEITRSPASYVAHANEAMNSLETVVSTALEDWLPTFYDSADVHSAMILLAQSINKKHRDPWLLHLLALPSGIEARIALTNLSESIRANAQGEHRRASESALTAERLFRKLGNAAGILRSRIEAVYALHRRFNTEECLCSLHGLQQNALKRGYRWIEGQAWLEKISCQTLTEKIDLIGEREEAYQWISRTGYEVLALRALNFLIEPYVAFGSRLKIWERGRYGLKSFWKQPIPGVRGEQLCLSLALSARSAGDRQTALVLLQEGALALHDSKYRQLLAGLLADLGAWQSEVGLPEKAVRTFDEVEKVFQQLNQEEMQDFRRETEVAHAQAEIAAGHAQQAVTRLKNLTSGMDLPYSQLVLTVRGRLLPVFGDALLATGDLNQAEKYYQEAINEYLANLSHIRNPAQRDNAQHIVESAWRGLTDVYLRSNNAEKALAVWQQFRSIRSTTNTNIKFKIPPGFVLLSYAFLPKGLSAWLMDDQGIKQRWITSKTIVRDSEQFAKLVSDPDSRLSSISQSARRVYTSLIAPFRARLPKRGVLVVDPDGVLASIPWLAIEDEHQHPLVERFAVVQAVGWQEAIRGFQHEVIITDRPLIFAQPTLGRELLDEYPPSIDVLEEARRLHARLPHADYVQGHDATLQALLERAPSSTMFHFAGHGVSYGGFGALLLAPSRGSAMAAELATSENMIQIDLSRLQLLVLASCSSGAGEQYGLTSLDSLVRSFLQAKAARVVASRWNVSSAATSDLMTFFYDGVLAGQIPAEALRNAAAKVRRSPSNPHPYFWASFQVFGAP